ncbi:MAG: hypothetical protein SF066_01375 [Thermoanaerobaculia bacterium]|nr:hypothetical protein [Thermoanaerobaculia bacterium]
MFDKELAELDELDFSSTSGLPDEARAAIYGRMRAQAQVVPERLAGWIQTLDPTDSDQAFRLSDVYEALAPAAVALEAFFLAELNRLLSVCEAHPDSKPAFYALGALGFLQDAPESFRRAARDRLVLGLGSSSASVRRACVDLLGDHDVGRDAAARTAAQAALRDGDWKVRALAECTLSDAGLLPQGYRTPLIDRLRRKMGSWTNYV